VNGPSDALETLRCHLERAEADLRAQGYVVDRRVTPPGAFLSEQSFDADVFILVLFGTLTVRGSESDVDLHPGDRIHVPCGVPFSVQSQGESNVYWLHASRKVPTEPPKSEVSPGTGG